MMVYTSGKMGRKMPLRERQRLRGIERQRREEEKKVWCSHKLIFRRGQRRKTTATKSPKP